jgi:hypothetical protein
MLKWTPGGDGGGGVTATGLPCGSCGTELPPASKFCKECGAPVAQVSRPAEYKQVTVLFADVVRSMDLAAALDMERWREIVTELAERAEEVVQRYGGSVEFTGDGVMAIFRPCGVGGSRCSGVSGRAGHPGGDQPAGGGDDSILIRQQSVDALVYRPPGLVDRGSHALKGNSAAVQVFGFDPGTVAISR